MLGLSHFITNRTIFQYHITTYTYIGDMILMSLGTTSSSRAFTYHAPDARKKIQQGSVYQNALPYNFWKAT